MQIACPEIVMTGSQGQALCVDEFGAAVDWTEQPAFQIDMNAVAEPFGVGFLLVASCWALGHGVSLLLDLVRR